ncbi:MAG TPA: TolC family protein [Gemmatimonadaceae bacterium]|jgi:outer membrane protein|nr:TolC family protein [Gemmatimonadaceae bacterium]
MTHRWQWSVAALAALAMIALGGTSGMPRLEAQETTGARGAARPLSLDEALRLAEGASEDVAVARAGVTRASGQRYKARSQFLPQLFGSASYTRTLKSEFEALAEGGDDNGNGGGSTEGCTAFVPNPALPLASRVDSLERAVECASGQNPFAAFADLPFGQANKYDFGLSLSQNIFTGGRVTSQYRAARAGERTAEIGLTSARAQLLLDVTEAYYDAALSDRLVSIARATLAQAETTLVQTRIARQVGNQPEFDLLRAQVTRDNQRPVLIQRLSDRDIAYTRLKQLLNLPMAEPVELSTSLDDTTGTASARLTSLFQESPDTSTEQRAPVRQARENVTVNRSTLTVARSQRLPTITLGSQYGRVAYPSGGLPEWGTFRQNWTVVATAQMPIFTGGNIRGDELIARANLEEARARLQQTRELAELDTRNTLNRLAAARASWEASTGTVEQATRAYQIAEVRYREGISTQTELADSRILLEQAQANRALASRDLQVARMRLALLRDLPIGPATGAGQGGAAGQGTQRQQQPPAPSTTPQQQAPRQAAASIQAGSLGVAP